MNEYSPLTHKRRLDDPLFECHVGCIHAPIAVCRKATGQFQTYSRTLRPAPKRADVGDTCSAHPRSEMMDANGDPKSFAQQLSLWNKIQRDYRHSEASESVCPSEKKNAIQELR